MILELEITDLSRGGSGVAKDPEGRIVFVPFTAPGDRVRVQLISHSKNYSHAKVLEILHQSPSRVTPPCPVYGRCGGCQWQHISYPLEWSTKHKGVLHALERAGVIQSSQRLPCEAFPADQIWEYRMRIQLRGSSYDGQSVLGYYQTGSHDIVPIDRCEIARPEINQALNQIQQEAQQNPRLKRRPYKVEIEVAPQGQTPSVRWHWNSKHAASGFRQIHEEQNEKLKAWVTLQVKESHKGLPKPNVLDLYGGSGNLSLPLAEEGYFVDCVDWNAGKGIKEPNEIPSTLRFHSIDALAWLKKQKPFPEAAIAILDPPRQGLGPSAREFIQELKRLNVKQAIAIGCEVDAWTRDLLRWQKEGFELIKLALFDLFPRTLHVESAGVLVRS